MSATAPTPNIFRMVCVTCAHDCEQGAKFCSECGTVIDQSTAAQYAQLHEARHGHPAAPSFATVAQSHVRGPNEGLRVEAGKLMLLLARERLFLYIHWLFFLGINAFGVWTALKCYNEYFGDDMTRIMMGSTPILYINSLSLLCIVPIHGTKKEIARLKEKLNYIRFQMEYSHLL